jgi:hypothetical protein
MKLAEAVATIEAQRLEIEVLKSENVKLLKEQKEFQDELFKRVQEIKKMGPFKRFMAYGRLLWDLIAVIEQGIRNAHNK